MTTRSSLSDRHREAVLSNPWIAALPAQVRADILACATLRMLAAGQSLYRRGDAPDGVYCVVEGLVCVSGVNRDGRQTVLDFYGPGSWIGEISTLDGGPRVHDIDASGPAQLLQVRPPDLEALLARHPALSRALLTLEAQRLRVLFNAIESYSTQTLAQRLANRLLMLAGGHGVATANGVEIRLQLSQETLARLIGSTRQRVTQVLKDWEREGVVRRERGHLVLKDRARLETFAQL